MSQENPVSIGKLILIPALITLGVSILRLVGELQNWPAPLFSREAGGGGAIVGISWLPIIFGIYFALKLTAADRGPKLVGRETGYVVGLLLLASGIYAVLVGAGVFQAFQSRSALRGAVFAGLILLVVGGLQFIPWSASAQRSMINAVGFAVLGLVLMVGGAYLFGTSQFSGAKLAAGCVLIAASALIPILGWPSLTKALLVYGYAARIPVAIIMYFAIAGNWGTHYDGLPPNFPEMAFLPKFLLLGVLPQMIIWIAFTVIVGMLFGSITAAIARRGKTVAPAT